jgi:hypothetical protein
VSWQECAACHCCWRYCLIYEEKEFLMAKQRRQRLCDFGDDDLKILVFEAMAENIQIFIFVVAVC